LKNVFLLLFGFSVFLSGCGSAAFSLPNRMVLPLPATSDDAVWVGEANKMTGEVDELVIQKNGENKFRFTVGDRIKLEGKIYIVEGFVNSENHKDSMSVVLQAKE